MTNNFLIIFLADGLLLPIVLVAVAALLYYVPNNKKFVIYSRIVIAGLTALLIAKFMAAVYQPSSARPFELLGIDPGASYLDNPGFPSDHAVFAATIFYAVWYGVRRRWIVVTLGVAVALVCIGRILALVHTPLDVVGGLAAASIGALWYLDDVRHTSRKK
jgi:membrane-associated phospholipid phosphatase